jgi:hypothetical protein
MMISGTNQSKIALPIQYTIKDKMKYCKESLCLKETLISSSTKAIHSKLKTAMGYIEIIKYR